LPHKRDGPVSQATTPGPEETESGPLLPLPEIPRKAFPPAPLPKPITVTVDGAAVAKGRPRFVRRTGIAFTPFHVRKYRDTKHARTVGHGFY
jgi:hypothetical protein